MSTEKDKKTDIYTQEFGFFDDTGNIEKTQESNLNDEPGDIEKTIVIATSTEPLPKKPAQERAEKPEKHISTGETVKNFLTDTLAIFQTQDVDRAVQTHTADTSSISITPETELALVQDDIDGKFKVQSPFAKGGQGSVAKGNDLNLQRLVAIKTLHSK